jgi:ATP-dependent DNA ligase
VVFDLVVDERGTPLMDLPLAERRPRLDAFATRYCPRSGEVAYDHTSGGRLRHGTRFVRWRPDKAPEQCTMDQLR